MEIKFLEVDQFAQLYRTFVDSFSNYSIPFFPPTLSQFRSNLERDGVDISRSVGAFDNGRLIGFSLNGFGDFSGEPTAYVVSTGILAEYRQRRIASSLFEWMFPKLKEQGCRQMALEVISSNQPAISLYEKLGFTHSRELRCYQQTSKSELRTRQPEGIEIRQQHGTDPAFASFWDSEPSWQNSLEAVRRAEHSNRIFAAHELGSLVGYIVVEPHSGTLIQIGVARPYRRKGIGYALLRKAQRAIRIGKTLRILNVDASGDSLNRFLESSGFARTITQLEMTRRL